MGYWWEVHKRAWRETRELLRLDQPGRVFLYLTGAIVPPVSLFIWEGTLDAAVKGLAAAGALLIAGLAIYLFKMLVMPARIARETAEIQRQDVSAIESRHSGAVSDLEHRLLTVQRERDDALNPPLPADAAQALYQRQGKVATVTGSHAPEPRTRTFDLEDSAAFDLVSPFWFGDEMFIVTHVREVIGFEAGFGGSRRDVKRGVETIRLGTTASLRRA